MSNLNLKFRSKYGLDWPSNVVDPFIELILAKKYAEEPFCSGNLDSPGEHMWRAIRMLLPESFCQQHAWSDMMVNSFCQDSFAVWIGGASAGKSHLAGMLAVLDFITDPDRTYTALASTSLNMLKLRSFASCIETLRLLKQHPHFTIPVKEAPSQNAIINSVEDGASEASLKYALRGVAISDGNESKAVARLAGVHPADGYASIILDEASALPEAAAKARVNAAAGTRRFRFLALANPTSRHDEATRFCEPLDGWNSVNVDTEEWYSPFGHVLHFNAFNSPAMREPDGEKKYPFLLSRKQIETTLREAGGNMQDPLVYSMILGFPRGDAAANTVLSQSDLDTFQPCREAVFTQPVPQAGSLFPFERPGSVPRRRRICALDPAFVSDGDGCCFIWGELDPDNSLHLSQPELLPIDGNSQEPAAYQVVRQAVRKCRELGIPLTDIAIDDSGTQSIAAIWQIETGHRPAAYNYATRSSEPGEYANLVTEMWYKVQQWVRAGRIHGLSRTAAIQFCTRTFKKLKPRQLIPKKEYKAMVNGRSPDEADATAMLVQLASTLSPAPYSQETIPQKELDISMEMYDSTDPMGAIVGNY